MSQWGKNDAASNSVLWGVTGFKKAPTSTNRNNLFGNTTSDAFVTGIKIGQFGVDDKEIAANPSIPHSGWVLRKEGSGGRANRVTYETLVTGRIPDDAADDTPMPDYSLTFVLQPSNASGNSSADAIVTFSANASSTPSGATIVYKWQKWGGSSFSNLSDAGAYSNTGTKTLSVLANTASNGEIYRLSAANTQAATIYSSNAVLTITT